MTQSSAAQPSKQAVDKDAIRPFPQVNFTEAELTELPTTARVCPLNTIKDLLGHEDIQVTQICLEGADVHSEHMAAVMDEVFQLLTFKLTVPFLESKMKYSPGEILAI